MNSDGENVSVTLLRQGSSDKVIIEQNGIKYTLNNSGSIQSINPNNGGIDIISEIDGSRSLISSYSQDDLFKHSDSTPGSDILYGEGYGVDQGGSLPQGVVKAPSIIDNLTEFNMGTKYNMKNITSGAFSDGINGTSGEQAYVTPGMSANWRLAINYKSSDQIRVLYRTYNTTDSEWTDFRETTLPAKSSSGVETINAQQLYDSDRAQFIFIENSTTPDTSYFETSYLTFGIY